MNPCVCSHAEEEHDGPGGSCSRCACICYGEDVTPDRKGDDRGEDVLKCDSGGARLDGKEPAVCKTVP